MNSNLAPTKRFTFFAIMFCSTLIIILAGGEALTRLVGLRPVRFYQLTFSKKFYRPHEIYGYNNTPGQFRFKVGPRVFTPTILPDNVRATSSKIESNEADLRKQIWIFGCSYTFGWGLNDQETFAWQLQEKFPQFNVVNFGTNGYGTIHSYLRFGEELKSRTRPFLVIQANGDFHRSRNISLRNRVIRTVPTSENQSESGVRFLPKVSIDSSDRLVVEILKLNFFEPPLLRYSSLVTFLNQLYGDIEAHRRNKESILVQRRIITEFSNLALNQGAHFLVANVSSDRKLSTFMQSTGIPHIDIFVSTSKKGRGKYSNYPYDGHPNFLDNQLFAKKLSSYISQL